MDVCRHAFRDTVRTTRPLRVKNGVSSPPIRRGREARRYPTYTKGPLDIFWCLTDGSDEQFQEHECEFCSMALMRPVMYS